MAQPPNDNDLEFLPPADFVPHTQIPTWIILTPLSPQARSAHEFLFAHVNPSDGTFLVTPSMASIAKYLGVRSENSARKYVSELKAAGLVTSIVTYWDRKAKKRTTKPVRDDGVKNDQTSNTFQMRWAPQQGRLHPGPLTTAEWYKPSLIEQRIAAEKTRQAAQQTPPLQHSEGGIEQEKLENPQVGTPLNSREGPPSTHEGDPPSQIEDEVEQGKNTKPTNHATGDEAAATKSTGSGNDGWLETSKSNEQETAATKTGSVGSSLLQSLKAGNGQTISPEAVAKWAPFVDSLLDAGHAVDLIARHLTEGARQPGFIIRKLEKLHSGEEHLPAPQHGSSQQTPVTPRLWCGDCDPTPIQHEGRRKPACSPGCSNPATGEYDQGGSERTGSQPPVPRAS